MASLTALGADEIGSKGTGDEFYAWCARGELRLRRCLACREWCHVPRVTCPNCASTEFAWEPVKGTGRLYTWTVVHRDTTGMRTIAESPNRVLSNRWTHLVATSDGARLRLYVDGALVQETAAVGEPLALAAAPALFGR